MLWSILATCLVAVSASPDDSLRSALHAVQKRQRELTSPQQAIFYARPNLIYGDGQPEDIGYGYQKSVPGSGGMFEAIAIPYSELGASFDPDAMAVRRMLPYELDRDDVPPSSKRSMFRERAEGSDTNQLGYGEDQDDDGPTFLAPSAFRERMAEKSRLQNAHALVRNFAGLSRSNDDQPSDEDYLNVLNSIWEKYKAEEDPEDITEEDVEEILEYLANKDERKRQYGNYNTGYDFFNSPLAWSKRSLRNEGHNKRYPETLFDERYPYRGMQKRFPITKRSPAALNSNSVSHRHKKNTPEKQTDPKVAAELSNIFSGDQKKDQKNQTHTTTTLAPNTTQTPGQKEQTQVNSNSLKPLDVKKKSINWSDYFGIDRRKKSTENANVNNEWLLKKYLEAYGVGGKDKDSLNTDKQKKRPDEIDNKMRAMEDLILDQAIKYTGAHEGTTDSKEIQQVKDKVMSELTAAYTLEKMRRALGELKASMSSHKLSPMPHLLSNAAEPDYKAKRILKDKLASLDGKMEKKESFGENDVIDFANLSGRECPLLDEVEMRCKQVAGLSYDTNELFVPLCNLHSMCYLCGPALRAATPIECDKAFLEESEMLCKDDPGCFYMARRTLSTTRRLKSDPNMVCNWENSPCVAQFLSLTPDKR